MKAKNGEDLQGRIFNVMRRNNLSPRSFFPKLYKILIGTDKGPRAGPLIIDMGRENALKLIDESLNLTS